MRSVMASGIGTVKSVISGDTLILIGRASTPNAAPPELQMTLSNIQAPRLARGPGKDDEPYGWESREFLRTLVLGKQVRFAVEQRVASIGREFGSVHFEDQSLAKLVVRAGLARVKTGQPGQVSEALEDLQVAERAAQAEKLGLFSEPGNPVSRNVQWSLTEEQARELLTQYRSNPTAIPTRARVIIEYIRDGSFFRCLLLDGSFRMFNFSLAGIQCPKVANPSADPPVPGEPYGGEAKLFSEIRLLNREVDVFIQGIDKFGVLFGTILHPQGNISVELVKTGLARIVDWSVSFLHDRDMVLALRQAERSAKEARLKVFTNYVPNPAAHLHTGERQYEGRVVEVVSGDTVVIKVAPPGDDLSLFTDEYDRRVSLASIRVPRVGNPRRNVPDEPWAFEAKEYLRNRLIGKNVAVTVEYLKDTAPTSLLPGQSAPSQQRTFVTIRVGKGPKAKNVSCLLIEEGFAQVTRHRKDEERSSQYDFLLESEAKAQKAGRGLFSSGDAPPHRINDITTDSKKSREFFPFIQRQGVIRGIVDYVFTGSRYKVFFPHDNVALQVAILHIRCPAPSVKSTEGANAGAITRDGDAFGDEARIFARDHLMQRQVEVEVFDVDKNGILLAKVSPVTTEDASSNQAQARSRLSFAAELCDEGLARLDEASLTRQRYNVEDIRRAQEQAQNLRKGIWSIEPTEPAVAAEAGPEEEILEGRVSEIVSGNEFYVQPAAWVDDLLQVEDTLRELETTYGHQGTVMETRVGQTVAVLFDDGNGMVWNRGRVESAPKAGKVDVFFIDYGNRSFVPSNSFRPLPAKLLPIRPQAVPCILAFTESKSTNEDVGELAAVAASDLMYDKTLMVFNCLGNDNTGRKCVVAYDMDNPISVTENLVERGLIYLKRHAEREPAHRAASGPEFLAKLRRRQEAAKAARSGVWRFGDFQEDEHL